jgi:hypothetical protein
VLRRLDDAAARFELRPLPDPASAAVQTSHHPIFEFAITGLRLDALRGKMTEFED